MKISFLLLALIVLKTTHGFAADYASEVKGYTNSGVSYELGRQVSDVIKSCGVRSAKYVWVAFSEDKTWKEVSGKLKEIQASKECVSSSENLGIVVSEIKSRQSVWFDETKKAISDYFENIKAIK